MFRIFLITALYLISHVAFTKPVHTRYQVDVIVFTHQQSSTKPAGVAWLPVLKPNMYHAISLEHNRESNALYQLLPASSSQLRAEYRALSQKPNYHVFLHYSWIQPSNSQRTVAISSQNNQGWNLEGTLRIRQSNYYLLDTNLLFSTPNNRQPAFLFAQIQRLKPGTVYYLDHPNAGMLIKVHQVS